MVPKGWSQSVIRPAQRDQSHRSATSVGPAADSKVAAQANEDERVWTKRIRELIPCLLPNEVAGTLGSPSSEYSEVKARFLQW
ncbi:unnamed protein product [Lampetra planeri]